MKNFFILILLSFSIFTSDYLYSQTGWFQQSSGTNSTLYSVTFIDLNNGAAVGANGTILRTSNGGFNWISILVGTLQTFYSVYFINVNTGFIAGNNGIVLKTSNGGLNWYPKLISTLQTLKSIYFVNESTGVVVGNAGTIFKTTNGGLNWVSQNSLTTNNLNSVYFINASTGTVVGTFGTVKKTTNGGINWFSQTVPTTSYELTSIYYVNVNIGIITKSNYDYTRSIYRTTNGGNLWNEIYTGSVHSLRAIDFVNSTTGYLIGDEGDVFVSSNVGANWTFIPSGVSNWLYSGSFVNANTGWVVGNSGIILYTTSGGVPVPSAPVLISPVDNSLVGTLTPIMTWNSSVGATAYCIQISYLPNFSVITDSATVSNTNHIIPGGKLQNSTTYFWRVNASNNVGQSLWSSIWNFTVLTTGIKLISIEIPSEFKLYQNYPNPFNPSTKIKFDLPKGANLKIIVFDISGRELEILADGFVPAGKFEVNWQAQKYSSGIYFLKLISSDFRDTKRMILVK